MSHLRTVRAGSVCDSCWVRPAPPSQHLPQGLSGVESHTASSNDRRGRESSAHQKQGLRRAGTNASQGSARTEKPEEWEVYTAEKCRSFRAPTSTASSTMTTSDTSNSCHHITSTGLTTSVVRRKIRAYLHPIGYFGGAVGVQRLQQAGKEKRPCDLYCGHIKSTAYGGTTVNTIGPRTPRFADCPTLRQMLACTCASKRCSCLQWSTVRG